MKTLRLLLPLLLLFVLGCQLPAAAQIAKTSKRKIEAQTRKAERQARRAAKKAPPEIAETYLDMSVYNMKPKEEGRKPQKTDDGRDNYQFNKKGEPMVTDASVLTRKRLKRK